MPARRLSCALLAMLLAAPAMSEQPAGTVQTSPADALAAHIAQGRWELAYQRDIEFKPLSWKRHEAGQSSTCIDGDPRRHLLDWIARKGCSVREERELPDGYLLSGECRLKWLPGQPVPVEVTLSWGQGDGFEMTIRTLEHAVLSLSEQTRATRLGACPAP